MERSELLSMPRQARVSASGDAALEPDDERAQVEARLDALELVPFHHPALAVQPALDLMALTEQQGWTDLAHRARLVHADVLGRTGNTEGLGVIARQVNDWANAHQHQHLMARSELLLSSFFARIGDMPSSLDHAARSMELLPPDADPRLTADHLIGLATAYGRTRSYDTARERFEAIVEIADDLGDVQLRMAALNNIAYIEYWAGDHETSTRAAEELLRTSEQHAIPLAATYLDTVARAQCVAGDYIGAERTLSVVFTPAGISLLTEVDDLPEILLTLAECQRRRGAIVEAEGSLEHASRLCQERGLEELRMRVLQEQATLLAAQGRYRAAYERHCEFYAASEAIFSLERDARTRILATVFETEQAVRNSNRFRELSLRDPLTGLYNRRYVDERIPALLRRATMDGADVCVAIVDLDFFKMINDQLAHDTGDEVLRQIAPLLTAHTPDGGFAARLGGEEFLLAMPRLDATAAMVCCERLRIAIREHPWQVLVGEIPVTVSIGIAVASTGSVPYTELLADADRRLYAAKRTGRDRVIGPGGGAPPP